MADSHENECSQIETNSQDRNIESEGEIFINKLLVKDNTDFLWKGNLNELKKFMNVILRMEGKWSSPGGDTKAFDSGVFSLKWFGLEKEKLLILKDNKDKELKSCLETTNGNRGILSPQFWKTLYFTGKIGFT